MAIVKIIDDNDCTREFPIGPETVICTDEYVIPCSCGRVVLLDAPGNDSTGCTACKEENPMNNKEDITHYLEKRGWDYEHPGYWRYNYGNYAIFVGEYIGFYMQDVDGDCDQPFMTVTYEDFDEAKIELLKAMHLLNEDLVKEINMAITHDTFDDKPHWEWEGGSLRYPEGIIIYNNTKPQNFIEIHQRILINDQDRELDESEHEYLRDLADMITNWLNNNIA